MAISLIQATNRIFVPKADTTLVSASPDIRSLDMDFFHNELRTLETIESNDVFEITHSHTPVGVLGGTTYPRRVEIIGLWQVEFEDAGLPWRVRLIGGDSNIEDVAIVNGVSVSTQNSAGNTITNVGSGLTQAQSDRLDELWRDAGMDAASPKTVTENIAGESYDEVANGVTKEVRKTGDDTVITRQ